MSFNSLSDQVPYPPPATPSISGAAKVQTAFPPYPAPIIPTETLIPPAQPDNLNFNLNYQVYLPIVVKSYDRNKAVDYADAWAHGRNSNYPNYQSTCGCTDCTNYVSQAIHEGGLALKTGDWDPNDPFEWWYKPVLWWYENSNTWSATDWFNTYVHQYPNEFEVYSWPTNLISGDFFTMDLQGENPSDPPDGIPDHVRFIVGYGDTSVDQIDYTDGCGVNKQIPAQIFTLLINQHCVDRKHVAWDYNLPNNIGRWSIHVK